MLTAELVRARRLQGELRVAKLDRETTRVATELAERYVSLAEAAVGQPREALERAIAAVPVPAKARKIAAGLAKLVRDHLEVEESSSTPPPVLRKELFERAAAARRERPGEAHLDRAVVLAEVAARLETTPEAIDDALFSDLRSAHRVIAYTGGPASALVAGYDDAQSAAVLLRAVSVVVDVRSRTPMDARRLFRKLKFLKLLATIEVLPGDAGHRITIDGPFSLFDQVTRYGTRLALVLPALREHDAFTLEAKILWGKAREPLVYRVAGGSERGERDAGALAEPLLPQEVRTLLDRYASGDRRWRAEVATALLDVGGDVCVPDVTFERVGDGARVHLEVLGFWSRDAVFRRVAWLERRALPAPVLFAVPTRLRVSEQILPPELPPAIYVFKGTLVPRSIEDHLDQLAVLPGSSAPADER